MKELSKRISTGIIGVFLLIFIILKGNLYLATSLLMLSIIGLKEFYRALNNIDIVPVNYIGYLSALGFYISNLNPNISLDFFIVLIILLSLMVLTFRKKVTIIDVAGTILGIIYIPFLLSHIFYLDGTKYIWLIFIIAFGTDTFAYIFGNIFGKNKLCPNISPNKTIEGSLGGILGSLILTIIFALLMDISPILKLMILSIMVSIFSQIGDLVASRIKRMAGIKDYGFIFPGHGGVLDRFDSIIFSSPLIYYFVEYFLI